MITLRMLMDSMLTTLRNPQPITALIWVIQNIPSLTALKNRLILYLFYFSSTLHSNTHIYLPDASSISSHHRSPTRSLPAIFLVTQKSMEDTTIMTSGTVHLQWQMMLLLSGDKPSQKEKHKKWNPF